MLPGLQLIPLAWRPLSTRVATCLGPRFAGDTGFITSPPAAYGLTRPSTQSAWQTSSGTWAPSDSLCRPLMDDYEGDASQAPEAQLWATGKHRGFDRSRRDGQAVERRVFCRSHVAGWRTQRDQRPQRHPPSGPDSHDFDTSAPHEPSNAECSSGSPSNSPDRSFSGHSGS